MKKKKKSNTPRHKRLNRISRLQVAKHWIPKYKGKNIIKGYSVHFGVDKLCAVHELELIGLKLDKEYIKQLKRTMVNNQKNVEKKRKAKEENMLLERCLEDEFDYYFMTSLDLDGEETVLEEELPF